MKRIAHLLKDNVICYLFHDQVTIIRMYLKLS
jgi:hypothetical protein